MDSEQLKAYLADAKQGAGESTEIVVREGFGRVVVAKTAFETIGETILRERPLLVSESCGGGYKEMESFLFAYLEAPLEVKELILDMYTPPFESELMLEAKSIADVVMCQHPASFGVLGHETVWKLIGVVKINAHAYSGTPEGAFYEIESNARQAISGKLALFAYGSKISHSCSPNATYTSKTSDGCLVYKVIAPVKKDDLITFPYIDASPDNPTHLRRLGLLVSKEFFCECSLCSDIDYARAHHCSKSACDGHVVCTQPDEDSEIQWLCTVCGPCDDQTTLETLKKEQDIQRALSNVTTACSLPGGLDNIKPNELAALVDISIRALSSTHYLTLQILKELSRLMASHAARISQAVQMGLLTPTSKTPVGSLYHVRVASAEAGLRYVRGCECIAAKCFGEEENNIQKSSTNVHENHLPVFACAVSVFHAFVDLKNIPERLWPAGAVGVLRRYVSLIYVRFGKDDSDAKEMDAYMSTMTDTAPEVSLPTATGSGTRTSKGKRGKRTNKKKKGKKHGR